MFEFLKYRAGSLALAVFLLAAAPAAINAQVPQPYKLSVKSNLLYDAALIPSVGVEIPVWGG